MNTFPQITQGSRVENGGVGPLLLFPTRVYYLTIS